MTSESGITRFVPKHEARSAQWWVLQRISGAFTFVLLGLHMVLNHYLNPFVEAQYPDIVRDYGIASFRVVQIKMANPLYLIVSFLFVIFLLFHAFNGVRTVWLDIIPGDASRRFIGWAVVILIVVLTLFTLWLNFSVAQLPG
ncbi:MAG: hypothetical protein ACFFE8_12890 [Candidatus Heimdallarchaeota archaeon]